MPSQLCHQRFACPTQRLFTVLLLFVLLSGYLPLPAVLAETATHSAIPAPTSVTAPSDVIPTSATATVSGDGAIGNSPYPTDTNLAITLTQSFREAFSEVLEEAQAYLKKHHPKNAAVVLDMDETIMDNRAYFAVHKRYDSSMWDTWVDQADAPAIPETLDFYRWLKHEGFKVYFVTGRKERQREVTERNLKRMGVCGYTGLIMKPNDYQQSTAVDFKVAARKSIQDKGQPVVLILGDQASDLRGGYGEGFKLPNPIYTIP